MAATALAGLEHMYDARKTRTVPMRARYALPALPQLLRRPRRPAPLERQQSPRCAAAARSAGSTAAAANDPTSSAVPETRDAKLAAIRGAIRAIPDFPKPGILFQDVSTLLLDPQAFCCAIDLLVDRYKGQRIECVAGLEARGFLIGPPLALALGVPFVMLRKAGKLPGPVVGESYATEYSTDRIEVSQGAVTPGQRVLLVDDLIATGGTLVAGANLIRKVGGTVVEAAVLIELPALKGREKLGPDLPLFTLLEAGGG